MIRRTGPSVPMGVDMRVEERAARPTAVVRRRTTWDRFPSEWGAMLDAVYEQVRAGAVEQDGHNVMLYRDLADGRLDVEVGVAVAGPFPPAGSVEPSELPGGTVAVAVHRGAYARLGDTHGALGRWCAQRGLALAGPRWEIYGDWHEDESALETEVVYLLG